MSKLYFRLGGMEGFTSNRLANSTGGFSIPIRELLQNSLDASVEAGNKKCKVDIYVKKIPKSKIPHIKDYEKVLDLAVKTQSDIGSYNDTANNVVGIIKDGLDSDNLDVLMVVDNGEGMNERVLEGLLDERSMKTEEASGSYGAGHITSYYLSSLRYVLYATKYRDENKAIKPLWTGSPILAGHRDEKAQRGPKGRIVKNIPENEANPQFIYPSDFPTFIKDKMAKLSSTGSMVVILGLNELWSELAEYAIVNSFFPALIRNELVVHIHLDKSIEHIEGGKHYKLDEDWDSKLDEDWVSDLVEDASYRTRRSYKTADILSGQEVYHAYKAMQESREIIQMDNGEEVSVYIRNDIGDNSSIVLIRNGMVITNYRHMLTGDMRSIRDSEDYEPFMVVIDVDQNSAPEFFKLVKGAENVHHNKLERNRLKQKDEKKLKAMLRELADKIREHLRPINRESFDLPLFLTNKASEKASGGYGRSIGQRNEAKPRPPSLVRPTKPHPSEGKPHPSRDKPNIELRNLSVKKATRYVDKGKFLEIEMRVIPTKQMDDQDGVYLSIALGEDNDNNRASEFVDFINLFVNGKSIPVQKFEEREVNGKKEKIKANQQIQLGMFDEGRTYNIQAKVKKPAGFEKMKVALSPILGLKRIPGKVTNS